MGRVLVIDSDPQVQTLLRSSLGQDQHVLSHAAGLEEARLAIRNHQFETIVTGQKLPDGDGLDVVATAREMDPHVSIVVLTAPGAPEDLVETLRKGVFDVATQPFLSESVRAMVHRACEYTALLRENSRLKAEMDRLKGPQEVAAGSNGSANGNHNKFETGWIENLPPSFDLRGLLATLEKSLIERTLQSTGGAQAEAARRLGLSRSDLSYKLLKYELRKETTAAS